MSFTRVTDFNGGTVPAGTINTWVKAIQELQAVAVPVKGINVTNAGNPIATTSGTTELDLAKLQLPALTLTTGRNYEVRYAVTFTKTVGTDTFEFRLRANTAVSGTQLGLVGFDVTDGRTGGYREFAIKFKGDPTYTSLYLSVVRTAGTGVLAYYGTTAGFVRTWAELLDRGDSGNWTDVA